jgi:hypothetical protein
MHAVSHGWSSPDVLAIELKRDGLINMHDSGMLFRFPEKGAQRFA